MLGEGLGEEDGGKVVVLHCLDVFVAFKTHPSEIMLAWAS